MRKLLTAGIFGTIFGIVSTGTAKASIVSSGFLDEKLTEYALSTSLDLKANQSDLTALSNKIGTLPDDITVSEMLTSSWKTNGTRYAGLSLISENIRSIELAYNTRFPNLFLDGVSSTTIDGVDYTGPVYPLWKLSEGIDKIGSIETKIGTLPSGSFPEFPGYDRFFFDLELPLTYPTSLAELINAIYGNSETGQMGLLERIIAGIPFDTDGDGRYDSNAGTLSNFELANANATKIGTLPSGNFPEFPYSEDFFSTINQPLTYPTSLAELINAIYGNSETGSEGLLSGIITGFPFYDTDGDGSPDLMNVGILPNFWLATRANDLANSNATKINANTAKIGTVPDGKNLAGMISETDAKIGTLPAGYDSVGAALTAIKGIAEDAKAAALAAIPDPKQEGSSGKFVLTVDIVGDNATYHWEKIDREGETTTTE